MSVRSFGALRDDARLPLPYSGSLGHRFATYQRYYGSLRRLSFRLGLLRLSLVSRYLAVSLFFCMSFGLRETSPNDIRRIGHPAPLHCLTGNVRQGVDRPPRFLAQPSARMPRSMTPAGSTIPPSPQYHRVLPSACMDNVGFPRLYNISGLNHAACVLASRVLHGAPRGLPRTCHYRPADGLWPGGTCTHWLRITNFNEAWPRIPTFQTYPGTPMRLLANALFYKDLYFYLSRI